MTLRPKGMLARALAVVVPVVWAACSTDSPTNVGNRSTAPGQSPSGLASDSRGDRHPLVGHLSSAIMNAPVVDRVLPSTPMHLAIALPVRNSDLAQKRVRAVSDPTSPTYRHYITPEQYAATYGATEV